MKSFYRIYYQLWRWWIAVLLFKELFQQAVKYKISSKSTKVTICLVTALTRTLPLLVMQLVVSSHQSCFFIINSRQILSCMEAHFKQDSKGLLRLINWSVDEEKWMYTRYSLTYLSIFHAEYSIRGSIIKIYLIKTKYTYQITLVVQITKFLVPILRSKHKT